MTSVSSWVDLDPAAEVGRSLAPVIVTTTSWLEVVVPSLATIVRVSVTESPPSNASVSESALSRVYVQAPVASTIDHEP